MSVSGLFIRRPVATTLIMLGIVLIGAFAYRYLPVSDLPSVDFPVISVNASLPGANPETMASAVATPLEKQFSTIAGIEQMTSTSSLGSTQVTLMFNLDRDIDAAAQDVQSAIAQTQSKLPKEMTPPSYQKVNPADQPIVYFALVSDTLPLAKVTEFAETVIAQRLSMLPGVAQVQIFGSQKYAVRVKVDPYAMSSRGIAIDDVAKAMAAGNVNAPTGTLWGADQAVQIKAEGQLTDASQFRPLLVTYRNGAPVRLSDFGEVYDSVQNDKVAGWFNDTRAIILAIQRQPGTNTVAVAQNIRSTMGKLSELLPAAIKTNLLYDRSVSILESVEDVKFTLVLTFALVVLVIFFFLRNIRATLIPSVALPLSTVGTFAVMYLMGYSIDNLSLMALTLSLGFVVDDAIVMLENIVRHMEMGKGPFQAAEDGAKEIGFTIISMTISLAAVFIPLLFMGGIIGRLFREFAVVISVAILISGVVSLTLTPMLCSRFLKTIPHGDEAKKANWLFRLSELGFEITVKYYEITLRWFVRHRKTALLFSLLILLGTVKLFMMVPKGFLPNEDNGQIFGTTEAIEGISFDAMVPHQKAVAEVVAKNPNVEAFMSSVGTGSASNAGRVFMRLKPRAERQKSAEQVIEELRPQVGAIPGIRAFFQVPPPVRLSATFSKSQYQYILQSPDLDALYQAAPLMEAKLRESQALQDVTSDLQLKNPQLSLEIDRDKASALGVSVDQIENTLYYAYGGRQVSTIYTDTNQYWVILQVKPEFQTDPATLGLLYVKNQKGDLVPLTAVTSQRRTVGPMTINHAGQMPAVTLSFNTRPGVALGDAVEAVNKAAADTLPASITGTFTGTAQAFKDSQSGMLMLLVLALVVIYIVLGVLYESFVHPITILSGLPFAGFGALLTLWLFNAELNVYSYVGLIMLIGVVKKNAIMMVDFSIEQERAHGMEPSEAILQACLIRFRPIMMTTMAALMGTLPIALGYGAGAESRRPLGLAVVGGLAFSQFITLYVTPVFYTYLDGFARRVKKLFGGGAGGEKQLEQQAG